MNLTPFIRQILSLVSLVLASCTLFSVRSRLSYVAALVVVVALTTAVVAAIPVVVAFAVAVDVAVFSVGGTRSVARPVHVQLNGGWLQFPFIG